MGFIYVEILHCESSAASSNETPIMMLIIEYTVSSSAINVGRTDSMEWDHMGCYALVTTHIVFIVH